MKTTKLCERLAVKAVAFVLVVISALLLLGSSLGVVVALGLDWYDEPVTRSESMAFEGQAWSDAQKLLNDYSSGNLQAMEQFCRDRNIVIRLYAPDGGLLWSNLQGTAPDTQFSYYFEMHRGEGVKYSARVHVDDTFPHQDIYRQLDWLLRTGYALRYAFYIIGAASLIVLICSFVFLMRAAGHRPGEENVVPRGLTKVPFDLLTAIIGLAVTLITFAALQVSWEFNNDIGIGLVIVAAVTAGVVLFTAWCMDFAIRIKAGRWWKNTVIFWILHLIWRCARAIWRGLMRLIGTLPLVWKTAVVLAGIFLVELIILVACISTYSMGALGFFWFLGKVLLVAAVLYVALVLRRLQKGGRALADGDLSYTVDTHGMVWDFRQHAEDLNRIGVGMSRAVEERLKSERMKTELITNVSHDIKTPLTSIVNYAGLIAKEKTENEKIHEYTDVLLRQSERLGKLIEDLVEASRAATGNVEVHLAPCEVNVLLTQTAGEYEQRLQQRQLELIILQPDQPVSIMADGRQLWRVFENLMNNICKYALSGTRVYLELTERCGRVNIAFKNTSREQLNIPAEELMERFVRGDKSRSTEGSGLGLSIARSLTELQKGKLTLSIDGDLFKVVLSFPALNTAGESKRREQKT